MISLVESYLTRHKINNTKIVVAISGGPDSVCLIHLLNILKRDYSLTLEAAYVNHGIRSFNENQQDQNLVIDCCNKLDIPLHIKNIPNGEIIDISKSSNQSIEAVARNIRYDFFNSIIDSSTLIALGHNLDDQIETQIMRFFQGSTLNGLVGIKERRENIIRPIIGIEKNQILNYLDKNSIPYSIDQTNSSNDYLRNRVRNQLMHIIEEIFPGYKKSLNKLQSDFTEYSMVFNSLYPMNNWAKDGDSKTYSYNSFLELPIFKRKQLIFDIFNDTYIGEIKDFRLPNRFLAPLSKASFKNNETILEGYGFKLTRKDSLLYWSKGTKSSSHFKLKIDKVGTYKNSLYNISVKESNSLNHLFIKGLDFPFNLRSFQTGFPEAKILKKLNNHSINKKKVIIVEKNNTLYAIILEQKLIYINSNLIKSGIYIGIE